MRVMGAPRFGSFLFGSLRGYRRGWLRADLVAGLAVWAVLVPESLAYAVLAGVPPVVGLWAAPATSWWGRCRPLPRSRGWSSAGSQGIRGARPHLPRDSPW